MNIRDVIAKYVELRDRKEALVKKQREEVAKITSVMDKIEQALFGVMSETGTDSVKTPAGTAFFTTRTSATVDDRDMFFDFVREHEAWDMLESRCAKSAVEQYLETEGELPPGVTRRVEKVVSIHRPQAKR
jgi:hypothetical protein